MSRNKYRATTFQAEAKAFEAMRRHARGFEDPRSMSEVLRGAMAEYLDRHARDSRGSGLTWRGVTRPRTREGTTPPRIMLHLGDRRRLELLRLHARTLKGTHRTVHRVIRAAIDDYLQVHAEELAEFLRQRREYLGDENFLLWKGRVVRGEIHGGRDSGKLWPMPGSVSGRRQKRR